MAFKISFFAHDLWILLWCRYGKHDQQSTLDGANCVTNPASRSDITADTDLKAETTAEHRVLHISECKCGMPLCICEAPVASEEAVS